MAVVAVAAVGMAAFRVHISLGSFITGVSCIALLRARRILERREAAGQPPGTGTIARTFLTSLARAALILTVSLIPAFFLLPVAGSRKVFDEYTVAVIAVSALFAIPIATALRRRLW